MPALNKVFDGEPVYTHNPPNGTVVNLLLQQGLDFGLLATELGGLR